ncbi:bifunctional 2-polyprenyl-6-hydroxyphenol methylase/3-demethylubiquinol 3-O-methyltransferase UbiG [Aeromicrobium sp. 9AM]|uniref:class I SAM-dependent methyltransferase n=1 Tax=Aeromicrobium sp. 9AM TaxID=2653126 RepID=UPI0012EF16C0|nr:class I SAM-dependent methyltransferase [Aeromicrobium sp. 9AM]VXC14006.1 conserved hypothetical protein [Aeromicrobium sp. 9AM]
MTSPATSRRGLLARVGHRLRTTARVLVKGAPAPRPQKPALKAPTRTRAQAKNVNGRWIRVVNTPADTPRPVDREVSDPAEAAAVRAGWLLIDAHERLSTAGASRVFGHELAAWFDYADDTIEKFKHPEVADAASLEAQIKHEEGKSNRLRYRRTMDFVRAGDRLFDVGFGRGYLASLLIRDADVESYHGIDIVDDWLKMSLATLAANGLADAPATLEIGDLYDLTKDRLDELGATFVICCEVLEHVPDAEKALKVLAEALPEGAELLFSVPLHGRLEGVWGHVSVFDAARLKQMLDNAGLYAHHVEPLANTWSLVVASRSPEPSVRVKEATGRPAVRTSVPLSEHRDFIDVAAGDMLPAGKADVSASPADEFKVSCHVEGRGGISFPIQSLEAMRLLIEFDDVADVTRFVVSAYAGNQKVAGWDWLPGEITMPSRRFWLRPGESSPTFAAFANKSQSQTADRVEVLVEVAPGRTADVGLKAAYLP